MINNKIKNFGEFTESIVEGIKAYLPESFSKAEISLQTVTKNNDLRLTGLNIRLEETPVCPIIYLENFFEDYKENEDMDEVLRKIAELRLNSEFNNEFEADDIKSYEKARLRIVPRLINKDMNKELLTNRPHKIIEDLAITYAIELASVENGSMSAPVTNEMQKSWDVTLSELHADAVKNLSKVKKGTLDKLSDVILSLMIKDFVDMYGDEDTAREMLEGMIPTDSYMYVLSCEDKVNGASQILNDDLMKEIVNKIGNDFYILPSSVHEVLIVKPENNMGPEDLRQMVHDVNATEVKESEKLSDNIYTWSVNTGLRIVE